MICDEVDDVFFVELVVDWDIFVSCFDVCVDYFMLVLLMDL